MPKVGDKYVVIVPIDVAEDLAWPVGTVAEVSEVYEDGSCEFQHDGVDASFAAEDYEGEYRWFDKAP